MSYQAERLTTLVIETSRRLNSRRKDASRKLKCLSRDCDEMAEKILEDPTGLDPQRIDSYLMDLIETARLAQEISDLQQVLKDLEYVTDLI